MQINHNCIQLSEKEEEETRESQKQFCWVKTGDSETDVRRKSKIKKRKIARMDRETDNVHFGQRGRDE